MKTKPCFKTATTVLLALAILALAIGAAQSRTLTEHPSSTLLALNKTINAPPPPAPPAAPAVPQGTSSTERHVVIKSVEAPQKPLRPGEEAAWLGVALEEAPEALTAQLGLDPGVGLVVMFVEEKSPAQTAGLEKNDLLVALGDQSLVHPSQFKKLIQVRKPGNTVRLTYYRAGKKRNVAVTLGKNPAPDLLPGFDFRAPLFEKFLSNSRSGPLGEEFRNSMKGLRDSLGHLKIDQEKLQKELRRNLEAARKTLETTLRESTNSAEAERALSDLSHARSLLDRHASVTVRRSKDSGRSIVKTDDHGTLVIVENPKVHLTAHDKEGKLLFDGEIETQEQKDKVPRDVWERVQPLLQERDKAPADKAPDKDENPEKSDENSGKGKPTSQLQPGYGLRPGIVAI